MLHETWTKLTSTDEGRRLFERPLHLHQTATIGRDENYLVATGTGSGKTESFLFLSWMTCFDKEISSGRVFG